MTSTATLSTGSLFGQSKARNAPAVSQLWPYSTLQAEKVPHGLNRLVAWKHVVEELTAFAVSIESLERAYAAEYEKLAARLQKLHSTNISFESSTGIPFHLVQNACESYAQEHTRFEQSVKVACNKQLNELRVELLKKIKCVKTETDVLTRNVSRTRAATIDMITLHEKAKARRVNAGPRDKQFMDPWLTERVLYKQLRIMIAVENNYQSQMAALLKNLGEFDEKIVVGLRRVAVDFLTARELQCTAFAVLLANAKGFLSEIETQTPFETYVAETGLLDSSAWESAPKRITDFPYEIQEIKVVKQSVMARPFFWSRTGWTQALYVVTDSGYLHCFKKVNGKAKGDERRKAAVNHRGVGWGFQKNQIAVVPPSSEMIEAELAEVPVYDNLDAPSTFFSVCLNNSGRISVNVLDDKSNLSVFAIDVYKTPRDKSPHKRYEIKASNEAEMIEWITFLNEKIESYLPQSPPQPLFSASHVIKERLEKKQSPPLEVENPFEESSQEETLKWETCEDFTGIDEITVADHRHRKLPELPSVPSTSPVSAGTGTIVGRTYTSSRKKPEIVIDG
ncbi:hypothetical protein HDU77_008947 [Chytriomyces hyalinus]|nr:hypothetical protein HDU77_008947 [Chytriomyces hyalinus]